MARRRAKTLPARRLPPHLTIEMLEDLLNTVTPGTEFHVPFGCSEGEYDFIYFPFGSRKAGGTEAEVFISSILKLF